MASIWSIQFRTLSVLIQRELQSRFGYNPLGMLLTVVQPLAIITVMATIRYVLVGDYYHGMSIIPFIATGVLTFQIFRDTATRIMGSIQASRSLLFLPQVTALDIAVSMACFQFIWWACISAIVTTGVILIDPRNAPDDYLGPIAILISSWAIGVGLGLLVAGLRRYTEIAQTAIQITMTPMLFLSGVFYVLEELPTWIHKYLLYNPILHLNEAMRDMYFASYSTLSVDVEYVLVWGVMLAVLGLVIERVSRSQIRMS